MRMIAVAAAALALPLAALAGPLDAAKPSNTDCSALAFTFGQVMESDDAELSEQLYQASFLFMMQAVEAGEHADDDTATNAVGQRAAVLTQAMVDDGQGIEKGMAMLERCMSN